MTARRLRAEARRPPRFHVHVVELAVEALPARERHGCGGVPVYVGHTGRTPEQRFAAHRAGGWASNAAVRRHGLRLRPDLTEGIGPFVTREAAAEAESSLAAELRARGFPVRCGEGIPRIRRRSATGAVALSQGGETMTDHRRGAVPRAGRRPC